MDAAAGGVGSWAAESLLISPYLHPPLPRDPQAARGDALAHFRALLQELHLAPDARWRDYAERVARDPQVGGWATARLLFHLRVCGGGARVRPCCGASAPQPCTCVPSHPPPPSPQGRGSNPALERGEAEALFREHVQGLYESALEVFLDLLDREIKVGCGVQDAGCRIFGGL